MIVEIEIEDLVIPQGLLPRVITGTSEEKVKEYAEMLEQGVEFDPITVWKRTDGQYWLVDGVHRTEAHKKTGKPTIKAKIVELKDELEYRIEAIKANLKHGLPLQKEEKVILAQTLYKLGVSISDLKKLFGVAERTLYYWLEPVKEQEKTELKKKALEMRKQGYTQEQVARELGVAQNTISVWENEEQSKISKIAKIANFDKTTEPPTPKPAGDWKTKPMGTWTDEDLEQAAKEIEELITDELLEEIYGKREEQKKSNAGRPKNEPPPRTDEEIYEDAKQDLLQLAYQTAFKIGWEKVIQLLDEVKERVVEVSKSAKRGW
jgi:ParB-like chromosome segregation protein Spo0J